MRVAVPTNNPGGLQGVRSDHFGHCDLFAFLDVPKYIVNEHLLRSDCSIPFSHQTTIL